MVVESHLHSSSDVQEVVLSTRGLLVCISYIYMYATYRTFIRKRYKRKDSEWCEVGSITFRTFVLLY
jgi:hypothetical protein